EFAKMLKNEIEDLDKTQKTAEAAMTDIATGQVKDLHQAAIAITKAESSMKFMLEVRNKAISAYKEITRTQI
ncbi:flagellar hook-basal body complex protein FliE, partial [Campylobacter coli]